MSAAEALNAARAAGIRVGVGGDDLVLEGVAAPPPAMLDLLSRNKAGILALLRPGDDGWSAEDWRAFFDERAGIAEFDGGLPRDRAEARAFACCVAEWLNRNPVSPALYRCVNGAGDERHDPLLLFGTEMTGHAWLHSRCSSARRSARKADAIAALEAMGIEKPAKFPDDLGKNELA
jgi:hypothetical protein